MPGFSIGASAIGGVAQDSVFQPAEMPFALHHRIFSLKATFDKTVFETACFDATTTANALYSKNKDIHVSIPL